MQWKDAVTGTSMRIKTLSGISGSTVPVIEQLVWVDLPQSYVFSNNYTYVGNVVSGFLSLTRDS